MADVAQTLKKLEQHKNDVFGKAFGKIIKELDTNVPFKTGKLRKSKKVRTSTSPTLSVGEIEYPTNIANYTDKGTKRHVIKAKKARCLVFVVDNQTFFRKKVTHPGTTGTKWWSKTVRISNWSKKLKESL